jgi:hypothetical protein
MQSCLTEVLGGAQTARLCNERLDGDRSAIRSRYSVRPDSGDWFFLLKVIEAPEVQ